MLTNTVILFIKDILPIFVLISFLSPIIRGKDITKQTGLLLTTMSLLGVYLIYMNIERLADMYDGDGIELFYFVVNGLVYVNLLLVSPLINTNLPLMGIRKKLLLASLVIFTSMKLSEFFIYFSILASSEQGLFSIIAGSFFGLGICASFSALFAIFLNSSAVDKSKLINCLWALYLAGFAAQNIQLLQQIDVISSGRIVWNSSAFIADDSEYGYLLNTLFGYIATPTRDYLAIYISSLAITALIFLTSLTNKLATPNYPLVRNKK